MIQHCGVRQPAIRFGRLRCRCQAGAEVGVKAGGSLINLCANNYLGLAQDDRIRAAAHEGLDRWGYGMASVRFICGTQTDRKSVV